jgi:hypothetical protein
VVTVE